MQHLESLGFIGWSMHVLSCQHQDDALLQAAVMAVAACAAYLPQRSLLHAHGIERAAGNKSNFLQPHFGFHLCNS